MRHKKDNPVKSISLENIRSLPLSLRFNDDTSLVRANHLLKSQRKSFPGELSTNDYLMSINNTKLNSNISSNNNPNNKNINLHGSNTFNNKISNRPNIKFEMYDEDLMARGNSSDIINMDITRNGNCNNKYISNSNSSSSSIGDGDKTSIDHPNKQHANLLDFKVNTQARNNDDMNVNSNVNRYSGTNIISSSNDTRLKSDIQADNLNLEETQEDDIIDDEVVEEEAVEEDEDEEEAIDEDQDEDFANVDEIDGPILATPRNNEPPSSPLLSARKAIDMKTAQGVSIPSKISKQSLNQDDKNKTLLASIQNGNSINSTNNDAVSNDNSNKNDNVNENKASCVSNTPATTTPISTSTTTFFSTSTSNKVDYNLPVDNQLKQKLEERAAQLMESKDISVGTNLKLDWSLKDFYGLNYELDNWFSSPDFSLFKSMVHSFNSSIESPEDFIDDEKYCLKTINRLVDSLPKKIPIENNSKFLHLNSYSNDILHKTSILLLTYIAMGTFSLTEDINGQLIEIKKNVRLLIPNLLKIIESFKFIAIQCRDSEVDLKNKSQQLFCMSTIIYFIVSVCLEERELYFQNEKIKLDNNSPYYGNLDKTNSRDETNFIFMAIEYFQSSGFLQFLTRYIEHWRWSSRLSMRIRNIINLCFKLLVLQFGDRDLYKVAKSEISKLHGIDIEKKTSKNLTISPLHYQAFREDIISRYPDCKLPLSNLPEERDNSNSLSQFLQIPRPKSKNPINLSLAEPNQHLATPCPSPPRSRSSSDSCLDFNNMPLYQFNHTQRSRKSLQTNMSFPNLYPSDDEDGLDSLSKRITIYDDKDDHDVRIPFSIKEASNILSRNVEIKLSIKQLWHERDLFMTTERGWQPNTSSDTYNYISYENKENNQFINIMKRVDQFYKDSLPSFNSLIFVLLQTIESNLSNPEYKEMDKEESTGTPSNENNSNEEKEKDGNGSKDNISVKYANEIPNLAVLTPQLEIIKAKQQVLRSSTGIIFIILRWLKLNHILKFEYFSVLLYDSRYFTICTALLNKVAENYSDKAFNRMMTSKNSLWKECSKYNANYTSFYDSSSQLPVKTDITVLSSLSYLLRILRKITGNKTQRIKELPVPLGIIFKKLYKIFNLDIYHPMLRIMRELTPFKNKRWKSEHMELISGVYLYEKLELIENWVTGKEISSELNDACAQEIALRALLQFYNFLHYEHSMEDMGYAQRPNSESYLINTESESVGL
ncbi:hypothetical protein TBLA_0D00410 [Henningerozyma blattae CBS 6284]|uniref:Factor arrest protein 11 n=1 Tax=Henningerozyma blattae (strain ATCC 34711 / CBS 6284 / DSM 70876 / NBRC 10599 / NRRL Y-10934 / UCD 77-7) TaxID=1071380 RepID=I2H2E9_HENB6|nr:hypothetical protein TBLA_0D00410 [Tetrapisispora blattae CBS 6284]CCH60551.1 hypothetical protein TBLA_0D00410 [Tetrapisispora blattae CBS 6284]